MSPQVKAALRSALTTFLSSLLLAIPVASVSEGSFEWAAPVLLSAVLTALRTLVAALDPGMGLYGKGAPDA